MYKHLIWYNLTHYSASFVSVNLGKWWIGLTDKQVEGKYVWETSFATLAETGYSNWDDGQPNNSHGVENCVYYSQYNHFKWTDTDCYDPAKYICELSM